MEIVFDLDGTLVDSHAQVLLSTQAFMAEYTGAALTLAEVERREGGSFEKTFANYGISPISEEHVCRWGHFALAHEYQTFPGVLELIEMVAKRGFTLHIWTARDALSTRHILTSLGLLPYFNGTIGCWNPRTPKPDPKGLAEIVRHAAPESVVVIGDSWTDRAGAEGYGAALIEAVWGHQGAPATGAPPARRAHHPSECGAFIDEIVKIRTASGHTYGSGS
jgi:phosphoglycolate phosphatase-like HAD superfamily hydrolase